DVLNPDRDLSRHPLFQVLFAFNSEMPEPIVQMPGVGAALVDLGPGAAKFDLTVALHEHDGEVRGSLGYATDLYDRATIERLIGWWLNALRGMVNDPACRVADLDLLTVAERLAILHDVNETRRDESGKALHQLIEAQTARTPRAPAVRCGHSQLTYEEL